MRLRDQVALTLPTLFLRIILGVIFLWAGAGKFMGTLEVSGADAARLANLGVMPISISLIPEPISEDVPESQIEPITPSHETIEHQPNPEELPILTNESNEPVDVIQAIEDTHKDLQQRIDDKPVESNNSETQEPQPPETEKPFELNPVQYASKVYSAADFPQPMQAQRLYSIALMISKAANPGLTEDSLPIEPILPAVLGSGPWPKVLAWAAAITEIVAGAFLILGLLTRFSALSIFSVMLVALWLTQFGPAVIQSNNALLGFIPRVDNPWSSMEYTILLWQLSIVAMSSAVFFMGSGSIGVDRLLFKPKVRDPYEHGDQKTIKSVQTQQSGDRSEFDRTPNPTP